MLGRDSKDFSNIKNYRELIVYLCVWKTGGLLVYCKKHDSPLTNGSKYL